MEEINHIQIMTEPVTVATCPKCGAMLEVPDIPAFTVVQCPTCEFEFPVPAKFGSFLLLQRLGMGGMGGVYRARDEALNREVAIKVMQKSFGDDPQFVETLQREAQAAAKLNHSNIGQIYSFGQVMGQPYIAMELVSGGSLDKMMTSQGALDPGVVFHIGAQIAEGLSEAADANIVHGDVKPENILFDAEKNAKLVDFGLAAMQSGPNHEVWGTPYYIAPEKVRKQKADFRADIYSLGATLYHAIAGVPPFDGAGAADVVKARFDGDPKPLRSIRGAVVSEEAEGIIKRMLSVDPAMRYPTYGSLLGDMRRYLSKAGPVNVASSGKKIMIKGKRPPKAVDANGEPLPEGMVPVDPIETPEETEREAKKRSRKFALMGCLGCGGLILVLAAIAGGILWLKASREVKDQVVKMQQVMKSQADAGASIAKSIGEAKKLADRITANIPEAMGYANNAAAAVIAVLGEDSRAWLIPPEPSYEIKHPDAPAAAEVAANAVPAQAGDAKISLPPELTEMLAKVLPEEQMKAVQGLDALSPEEAIAKIEEVVKALPQDAAELKQEVEKGLAFVKMMAGGMGNDIAAAMGGAMQQMAEEMDATLGDVPEEVAKYPVIKMVQGLFVEAYEVKKASALAASIVAEIEAMAKSGEALKDPEQVEKLIGQANAIVEKTRAMGSTRELTEVTLKVSRMKKTLESVKAEAASMAAVRQQEAVEKAKADQRAAEQEKQRQEREALQEKTVNEVAKVRVAEEEIIPMLKQLKIRDATRMLRTLNDELETKGGLEAQVVAQERVNRIEEFHKYLVEKTPGFKSSRGWSIEAADAKDVTVAGKKITWAEIFSSRMDIVGELVNGLVANETATKNMRLRERTRLETNAALCLAMFYNDTPSAVERAKQMATQAAENFEADAEIIHQLMPEFFE